MQYSFLITNSHMHIRQFSLVIGPSLETRGQDVLLWNLKRVSRDPAEQSSGQLVS